MAGDIRSMFGLQVGLFTKYICWGGLIPVTLFSIWVYTMADMADGRPKGHRTSGGYPISIYVPGTILTVLRPILQTFLSSDIAYARGFEIDVVPSKLDQIQWVFLVYGILLRY